MLKDATFESLIKKFLTLISERPFDWETVLLSEATLKLPQGTAFIYFQRDLRQVLSACSEYFDDQMIKLYRSNFSDLQKVHEKVEALLRCRFQVMEDHRKAVQRLTTFFRTPSHGPLALSLIHKTVNRMWYEAGDTATDWNYYTKRFLLSGVYGQSLIFWLRQDKPSTEDLHRFIKNRLRGVSQIPKIKGKFISFIQKCKGSHHV